MASNLPTTPNDNLGSNYGMDGFPGVDYGKGIRDRPGLKSRPPASGVSHLPGDAAESAEATAALALQSATSMADDANDSLPSHLIGNPQAHLDIDLSSERTAFEIQASEGVRSGQGVVHHEWQEGIQDPARLPHGNPNSVAELESLWSTTTTGQQVRQGVLQELLRVAMRRSAQGESLSSIRTKLETLARDSWPKVAKSFEAIAAEHGLHGNVYLRASAFPGLHRGKHVQMLRKLASKARYLVGGDKEAAKALSLIHVGSVQDIPWDRELQHYTPKLAAQGKRIQRVGSARESLRQVFLNPGEVRTLPASFPQGKARPIQVAPLPKPAPRIALDVQKQWEIVGSFADRLVRANVISQARREELQKSPTPQAFRAALTAEAMAKLPPKVQTYQGQILTAAPVVQATPTKPTIPLDQLMELRAKQQTQVRVEALARKLARQGAINPSEAKTLAKMGSMAEVRTAAQKLDRVPRGAYSGGYNLDAQKRQAAFDLQKQQEEAARVAAEEQERSKNRLKAKVARLQKGATHGEDLSLLIPRLLTAQEQMWAKKAIDLITARSQAPAAPPKANEYGGKFYTAHQSSAQASYDDHTLASAQQWLKRELHKDSTGTFVANELGRRFASVAKDPSLVQIRSKYAGQAGQVFIDAAAFASPRGVTGCEQAAGQFRTASAKYVLAMDRCQGCSCRNSEGTCRKYRRPLVASVGEIPK